MTDLPLTRVTASREKQQQIGNAVRNAENLGSLGRLARGEDVPALTELLEDPKISQAIYTLPAQINQQTIAAFIDRHLEERKNGEGLLMLRTSEEGLATAYYDMQFWPQWAACELGGAIRTDQQNTGQGGAGALEAFNWLFDEIGVELICETAALDNIRTARLLDRIGFNFMGEIKSKLPDGSSRPSHYWELSKDSWYKQQHKIRR